MENISWQERLKDKKKRRFFTKFLSYEDIELLDDTFGVQFNFNSYYPSDEAVEVNGGEIHITDISSISHQIDGGDKYLSEKLKIMQEKLYIMEEQMVINIKEFTEEKSMKMSQSEVERVIKEYVEKIEKENEDRKFMSDIIGENFHQFLEEESKKLKTKELSQDTTLEIIEILENKIKVLEGKVTLLESQQKEEFLDKFAHKTDTGYLDSKINLKLDKGSFIHVTDGDRVTLVKDENSESQITQTKGKITIDIKGGVIDIKDGKSGDNG